MCVQETAAEAHYHYHSVTTTSSLESNISQLSSRRASQLPTNTQYWEPVSVTAAAERRIETHRNHRSSWERGRRCPRRRLVATRLRRGELWPGRGSQLLQMGGTAGSAVLLGGT